MKSRAAAVDDHDDLHLDNVRFDGIAPTLFSTSRFAAPAHSSTTSPGETRRVGEPSLAEWEALLDGYNAVRPLTPEELRAIPALATLRTIWNDGAARIACNDHKQLAVWFVLVLIRRFPSIASRLQHVCSTCN
ncbi:MAG TPA: hypothetical protein VF403_00210 [Kofleriaceae bacterium]